MMVLSAIYILIFMYCIHKNRYTIFRWRIFDFINVFKHQTNEELFIFSRCHTAKVYLMWSTAAFGAGQIFKATMNLNTWRFASTPSAQNKRKFASTPTTIKEWRALFCHPYWSLGIQSSPLDIPCCLSKGPPNLRCLTTSPTRDQVFPLRQVLNSLTLLLRRTPHLLTTLKLQEKWPQSLTKNLYIGLQWRTMSSIAKSERSSTATLIR